MDIGLLDAVIEAARLYTYGTVLTLIRLAKYYVMKLLMLQCLVME